MPKHQQHDYYQYNFRLNKGDSVKAVVGQQTDSTTTLTWITGTAVILVNGAEGLAAATAVAVGAAFLSY